MVQSAPPPAVQSRYGAARKGGAHKGVDLYAPKGTPVTAPEAGVVVRAHSEYEKGFDGFGRVVVIALDRGGELLIAHLEKVSVSPGQRLDQGDVLGTVGDTAFTRQHPTARFTDSKPHAHVEYLTGHNYPVTKETQRQEPTSLAYYQPSKKKRRAA